MIYKNEIIEFNEGMEKFQWRIDDEVEFEHELLSEVKKAIEKQKSSKQGRFSGLYKDYYQKEAVKVTVTSIVMSTIPHGEDYVDVWITKEKSRQKVRLNRILIDNTNNRAFLAAIKSLNKKIKELEEQVEKAEEELQYYTIDAALKAAGIRKKKSS